MNFFKKTNISTNDSDCVSCYTFNNPFGINAPFLYPYITSFLCFQEI